MGRNHVTTGCQYGAQRAAPMNQVRCNEMLAMDPIALG